MRYHIKGEFKIERRKGFVTKREIDYETDFTADMNKALQRFFYNYSEENCHGIKLTVKEKN